MAGYESDLLKQATQAMMARYEGEYRFPFTWGLPTRYRQLFVRIFFWQDAICYGYLCGPHSPGLCWCFPVSFVSSDDVFSTCSASKLTRGLFPAAIGVCLSKPQSVTEHVQKRTLNRTWLFFAIFAPKERIFRVIEPGPLSIVSLQ
jgi:hypothetical protein